jgi:hypothetical protein
MNFTTTIPISKSKFPIDYNSKIVAVGSCFAENMNEKWEYFKFHITTNPFGILFNPVSIENIIERAINNQKFTDEDLFYHNELWHCFEVHSCLSRFSKNEMLTQLNMTLQHFSDSIKQATHFFITYGTSWVYEEKTTSKIVANCHKLPQNRFDKKLLSVSSIEKSIQKTIDLVKKINPSCSFIFTLSPVRHIKDGFVENNWSKAHLIAAVHEIIQSNEVSYFPSYEIMMDELRDYRFYANDLLHPNQTAIDYIWIKFFENYVNEKEFTAMKEVCSIQRDRKHKPFHPDSESHKKFLENIKQKINSLAERYPHIKFDY